MQNRMRSHRSARAPRARLMTVTALVGAVLVAGCGGASRTSTMFLVGGATTPAVTAASASASASAAPDAAGTQLAYAKCMRAHGVSNFPDPSPGGHGFVVGPGLDLSAPAFKAAQAKCQAFMPVLGGPLSGPGGPRFSEQSLVRVRKVAVCMRAHGISQFPDPSTTRPRISALSGAREITDVDGAYLVFPSPLDMESPAYDRAAAACGGLAKKLGRPH